ncbi:MAG TPA: nucleotide-binding protein [Reyranella sp.]|nr:nucleotide-binding protein [Reyranella sp.]
MFIASSSENLDLAYAAQEGLEHDVEATVWTQGVFAPSRSTVASLLTELEHSDFGLFILSPDDVTAIRDKQKQTVRDNVIFELGMFLGRLGPERCFFAIPKGIEDLHLPTDLSGLTPVTFEPNRQDRNLVAALGPACNRIRKALAELGAKVAQASPSPTAAESFSSVLSDPADCLAALESWMGSREYQKNQQLMRYDDVDREVGLVRGAARQFLEQAARRWNYVVARKGKDTILFKEEEQEHSWIAARRGF